MRAVLDTNVLLSGLLSPAGAPAQLLAAWRSGRFDLVTAAEQLIELGDVARRPVLKARLVPAHVGRFINDLRELAFVVQRLPIVDRSVDPADNYLLGIAQAGDVDFLVSGDRSGVLALVSHGRTRIVGVGEFRQVLGLPG